MPVESPQRVVEDLVASHGGQLRRFLMARVRNAADVPDIVQEVYLRMLRVPDVQSIRSPEAYLFTVARHVLQQHTLTASAPPSSLEVAQILTVPEPSDPALELDAFQCLERLQAALEGLSPKARATFLLHRRDGLSLDEIGERLSISRPMVKKYLMKALMSFRQYLEPPE